MSRFEWRRERDLNPRRSSSPLTRLAGEHFRPLSHPSVVAGECTQPVREPERAGTFGGWIRWRRSTASRRCSSGSAPVATRKRRSGAPPTRCVGSPRDELRELAAQGRLGDLPGIGSSTARVIAQALDGEVPEYLARLEAEAAPDAGPGAPIRAALQGDLHLHSDWSDGGATIEQMARKAAELGHGYLALTDHSPSLTIAHGLDPERLRVAARARRPPQRGAGAVPHPHRGSRSTSSTTVASTRTKTCSPSSTSSSPACTRSCACPSSR